MLFRLYSHSKEIAVTLEEKRELKVRLSRCSEIRRYWSCLRWWNEVRELKHSGVQKVWSQTRWVTFSVTQLSVRWEFKGFGRKKWQRNQNKCSQPTQLNVASKPGPSLPLSVSYSRLASSHSDSFLYGTVNVRHIWNRSMTWYRRKDYRSAKPSLSSEPKQKYLEMNCISRHSRR